MEISIPELDEIIKQIAELTHQIQDLQRKVTPHQEWYTLPQACELKGVPYGTIQRYRRLQPNHGTPDGRVSRCNRWRWKTVEKWCLQTDQDLEGDS